MPGWLAGFGSALAWEAWALRRSKQTLSNAVWTFRDGSYGWLLAAVWAALTWHFFFDGRPVDPTR